MAGAPSASSQTRMLELLRRGFVLAAQDQRVLRYLEFRRHARAIALYDARGRLLANRAWQITDAGVAASLRLSAPRKRNVRGIDQPRQIDLEEVIASASSGRAPECAPLPDHDTPTVPAAGASAPKGRPVETSARGRRRSTQHA